MKLFDHELYPNYLSRIKSVGFLEAMVIVMIWLTSVFCVLGNVLALASGAGFSLPILIGYGVLGGVSTIGIVWGIIYWWRVFSKSDVKTYELSVDSFGKSMSRSSILQTLKYGTSYYVTFGGESRFGCYLPKEVLDKLHAGQNVRITVGRFTGIVYSLELIKDIAEPKISNQQKYKQARYSSLLLGVLGLSIGFVVLFMGLLFLPIIYMFLQSLLNS